MIKNTNLLLLAEGGRATANFSWGSAQRALNKIHRVSSGLKSHGYFFLGNYKIPLDKTKR